MKKKAKPVLVEKYGSLIERYKSVAAKKKHEKKESKAELRKESKAEKAKAKSKGRTVANRGM